MKNIFKFMGIALLAGGLMVACNHEETEEPDTTPTDTTPVTPPAPQSSVDITWGGEAQTIGIVDAYKYSSGSTVFILNAAQGLENGNYVLPIFRFGFDLDTDPQYGCTMTAQWYYGTSYINGNNLWPTDVVEAAYYSSSYSQNMGIIGDWQLDVVSANDFTLANAQFDATALTLTASTNLQMFYYQDLIDYISSLDDPENYTNDDLIAGINAAEKKNLGISLVNYAFEEASSKVANAPVKK